jgi:YegS/Rv2252/BmrU family lipid kinase
MRFTRHPNDATRLVREGLERGPRMIAVAGGDGTLLEAVNGCMTAAFRPAAVGLIPVGTGNDFAKMLDLDSDWEKACGLFADGQTQAVDVGRCNDRYFINGVGIGFDAQVAVEANRSRLLRGNAVYLGALTRTLTHRYRTPRVRLEFDGQSIEQAVTLVAAANGRSYGGTFHMAPAAVIDDGLFELVIADALSRRGILRLAPRVMRGTHLDQPAVRCLRVRTLTVTSRDPLPVHADGEIIDEAAHHVRIEMLSRALTFLRPAGRGAGTPDRLPPGQSRHR